MLDRFIRFPLWFVMLNFVGWLIASIWSLSQGEVRDCLLFGLVADFFGRHALRIQESKAAEEELVEEFAGDEPC